MNSDGLKCCVQTISDWSSAVARDTWIHNQFSDCILHSKFHRIQNKSWLTCSMHSTLKLCVSIWYSFVSLASTPTIIFNYYVHGKCIWPFSSLKFEIIWDFMHRINITPKIILMNRREWVFDYTSNQREWNRHN